MLFPEISTIKYKRKNLGLSQKQLSKIIGISQSFLAKLESKKVSPSYPIAKIIFEKIDGLEHKKEGLCSEIINENMHSIYSSSTVKTASEIMNKNSVSQLPIFENKRLVGTISESGIYNKIIEGVAKEDLFKKKVKEIMEEPLPTISASTPTRIAMPLLKTNPAILLTKKDKIIGILTKEDFINRF